MSFIVGAVLLAVVTAVACALPGVFVVLRKSSMLVDAISHAVLPGIVVGYFFTRNLQSPWVIVGAALAGLLVVLGSEWLHSTGLLAGDASQGLIFPALFSVGVMLITLNFANVHLDTHAVLVGDLNLVAFEHLVVQGVSIGPSYLYLMFVILLVNASAIALMYPRLKVTTFDREFAASLGLRPALVNTLFMLLTAITVTAGFYAAGAILVMALVIVPAATAYQLTNRLPAMISLTVTIAAGGALVGFWAAYLVDAATSAGMAVTYGLIFIAVLLVQRVSRHRTRLGLSRRHYAEEHDEDHAREMKNRLDATTSR